MDGTIKLDTTAEGEQMLPKQVFFFLGYIPVRNEYLFTTFQFR